CRRCLERRAAGAPGLRAPRFAPAHLPTCSPGRDASEKLARLRTMVRQVVSTVAEPDWTGFWPPVRARIVTEEPRPVRESWWVPFWKPVWGHPRLAFGAALLAILVMAFSFWPADEAAFASHVNVQD